jgi:hypothetical protein
MAKKRGKKKVSKKIKKLKNNFNLVAGTIIFVLLIGSAFAIDWIFGIGFIFGFLVSIYNGILEKKPLIPIFLFAGALIIRYALVFMLSPIFEAGDIISLLISIFLFLIIIFMGYRLRKGKWKFWKFNPKKDFKIIDKSKIKRKAKKVRRKIKGKKK